MGCWAGSSTQIDSLRSSLCVSLRHPSSHLVVTVPLSHKRIRLVSRRGMFSTSMCHRQGLRCWSHVSGSLSTCTISGFLDCLASILHLSITIRIWCNARFLYFQYMAKRTEQPWFKIAASVGVHGTMSGFFDCLANILHLSITIRIWCNTGFLYFQYLAQRTEQPWFKIAASVGVNGIRRHHIGEPTELSTNALAQVLARRLGKVYVSAH